MTPRVKGLVIAALHVVLVASLGAKLLYDRATCPRVWAMAVPYDPDLPIRGRYVSLRIAVEARGVKTARSGPEWQSPEVVLGAEHGQLVARPKGGQRTYDPAALHVQLIQRPAELAVLDKPVAFFIPEHVSDPSGRPAGEELWVEVTIPRKGPPRPIHLGTRKDGGRIVPLELR